MILYERWDGLLSWFTANCNDSAGLRGGGGFLFSCVFLGLLFPCMFLVHVSIIANIEYASPVLSIACWNDVVSSLTSLQNLIQSEIFTDAKTIGA